jgi:hypothetical protein
MEKVLLSHFCAPAVDAAKLWQRASSARFLHCHAENKRERLNYSAAVFSFMEDQLW